MPIDKYRFLDLEPVKIDKVNNYDVAIFDSKDYRCPKAGPSCRGTFIGYSIKVDDVFYTFRFYRDLVFDNLERTILNSFNVIKDIKYTSPDNEHIFIVYESSKDINSCTYRLEDRKGNLYDIKGVLGFDTIYCSFGPVRTSSFYRWVDDDSFIISENYRSPRIVNLDSMNAEAYSPKNKELLFRQVNNSLDRWLFQGGHQGRYFVFDGNKETLLEIEDEYDRPVLYDSVNEGFLFIERIYTNEEVEIEFNFLDLGDLSMRHLLTTDPVPAPGRGCSPERVVSENSGEILLTRGCLSVTDKYLDEEGRIVIPL